MATTTPRRALFVEPADPGSEAATPRPRARFVRSAARPRDRGENEGARTETEAASVQAPDASSEPKAPEMALSTLGAPVASAPNAMKPRLADQPPRAIGAAGARMFGSAESARGPTSQTPSARLPAVSTPRPVGAVSTPDPLSRGGAASVPDPNAEDDEELLRGSHALRVRDLPLRVARRPSASGAARTTAADPSRGAREDAGSEPRPPAKPAPEGALLPVRPSGPVISPRMTAVFGGLFGLAAITSVVAVLIQAAPPTNDRARMADTAAAAAAAPSAAPTVPSKKRVRVPVPGPWRVKDMEKDSSVTLLSGVMEKKSFIQALDERGIPKSQAYRVMKAFEEVRKFDKTGKKDKFLAAFDKAEARVKAFEYEVSPTEIYQAREDPQGLLTGAKLDLQIAEAEFSGSFYVGKSAALSYESGGFEDGILQIADEALMGRASMDRLDEGTTVRVIAVEETALGAFARYKRILALEIRPPDPAAKPLRVYYFDGGGSKGYWDERGRQPYGGGWRKPCPGAPVTSKFNPKRLHPVLKKVMPHNGTDFGAPMGTPVYASYKGTVQFVGNAGPSGNLVTIAHMNGVETGYAHLSKFAPGIKIGDKLSTMQLVGYVGSTGRSTGPHLHFSAKKDGKFFDAETLHLDSERIMAAEDRPGFLTRKAELDKLLDAIPLPEPPPEPPKPVASAAPAASGTAVAAAPKSDLKSDSPAAPTPSMGAVVPGATSMIPPGFVEDKDEDDDEGGSQLLPGAQLGAPPKPTPAKDPSEEDDEK